ncbi:MAG: hypothetical protein JW776_16200 [Candidatus Lokiarchaeota archaeon]|nr:hypothetical protein [Candidatus Lokiarchaeota archaeon]
MKRYASIDFLRGLAIFLMIFVHTLMRWVWRDPIYTDMGSYSLFVIIFLLATLFLGGWCGLFLMVSATGNMISMYNGFQRNSVRQTIIKQIVGGILLLGAAILTESTTGYGGYFGNLALGNIDKWTLIFYKGYHFETIHAVAWCVILNGITQAILSRKGGWKKINRNIVIYLILIIVIVALTPSVWNFAQKVIQGYPDAKRTFVWEIFGKSIPVTEITQYGFLFHDSIWELTIRFFLGPLAGKVEPIFPFLAVSYTGSIIALFLIRKQKEKEGFIEYDVSVMKTPEVWFKRLTVFLWFTSTMSFISFTALWLFSPIGNPFKFMQYMILSFLIFALLGILFYYIKKKENIENEYKHATLPLKIGMLIGFALFVIGLIGVGLVVFMGGDPTAIDMILAYTYDVRALYETGTWLWWFCVVTGSQIGAFFLLLRVTEFRGKTHKFGQKTLFLRRFGFVPFSIYNYQFIDVIPALFLSLIGSFIPITDQYSRNGFIFPGFGLYQYGVYGIWILLGLIILMYWGILRLWQRSHFALGFEWFLAKISNLIIPSKRKERIENEQINGPLPWWQSNRLNVKDGLVSPQWVDIISEDKIPREKLVDSKFSFKLCWLGLIIAPISLISLGVTRTARKTEGKNAYNLCGLIISIIGAILSVSILIGTIFVFGISF